MKCPSVTKTASTALTRRIFYKFNKGQFNKMLGGDFGWIKMFLKSRPKKAIGQVLFDYVDDVPRIIVAGINDKKLRGLGLGKKMYGEIMRLNPTHSLFSDHSTSVAAKRIWDSFSKNKSYNVVRNSKHHIVDTVLHGKAIQSLDQKPNFFASINNLINKASRKNI